MAPIPTSKVNCKFYDQNGMPVADAYVQVKLDRTEVHNGMVVPITTEASSDANGECVLNLWPNTLGTKGSCYSIKVWGGPTNSKFLSGFMVVPDDECSLGDILIATKAPELDSAIDAMISAAASAAAAKQSAIEAASYVGGAGGVGINGKEVELRTNASHIQWRYVGAISWTNLVALETFKGSPGEKGTDGTNGINGVDGTNGIDGLPGTAGVDGLDGLDGKDGKNGLIGPPGVNGVDGTNGINGTNGADGVNGKSVQLQTNATHIQWRLVGDPTWINLVTLASITGPAGKDGTNGIDGAGNGGGGAPTGAAGGVLSGFYPNPDFAVAMPTQSAVDLALGSKVDKVAGKGLSTEDYSTDEKTKLGGIAANANNYAHPATHPASVIAQDATNRFVTDAEKATWSGKAAGVHTHVSSEITDSISVISTNMPLIAPTDADTYIWTLTANSTISFGTWASGKGVALLATAGAFTLSWPAGTVFLTRDSLAPKLKSSGVTALYIYKVSTTYYVGGGI